MIEHPDSENVFEKLTNFKKDCKMLENGEMNPEKQDSCPLPKEKIPVIKKIYLNIDNISLVFKRKLLRPIEGKEDILFKRRNNKVQVLGFSKLRS